MKIIQPYAKITSIGGCASGVDLLRHIERCARVCYRSEGGQTEDSYKKLLPALLASGHMSVFEHGSITVEFCVDRGIQQEITRHDLFSSTKDELFAFSIESTRYCSYDKDKFDGEIKVIAPEFETVGQRFTWEEAGEAAEEYYFNLINKGMKAQIARDVLPLCTASVIMMTGNPRMWRGYMLQRTAKNAHPKLLQVMLPLLEDFKSTIPILYDDIQSLADPSENGRKPQ